MAELLVVRSGTTDYDVQGRIRGNLDLPLTAAGRDVAAAAAIRLAAAPPVVLYASPTRCATETAAIIGRLLGIAPRRAAGFEGLDLGLWQGMLVTEMRRRQPRLARHWEEDPWTVVPPEGESPAAARGRVGAAIAALLARHPRERVAVVVPQPLDRVIAARMRGSAPGDLWTVADDDDAVAAFGVGEPRSSRPPAFPARGGALAGAAASSALRGWLGLAPP